MALLSRLTPGFLVIYIVIVSIVTYTRAHDEWSGKVVPLIAQQGGTIKDKNVTLTRKFNPILITKDIIINSNAKLTIEAGTEILFEKRKGIIVKGTLEILGNPSDRVRLHLLRSQKSPTPTFGYRNSNPSHHRPLVRLVDGDLPSEGRVQLWFKDRWHSLCTGSKNLTSADMKVLCRQVGYQDGHLYKWFPRRNDTVIVPQIMSKSFHCQGSETAISQCKRWNRIRTGGGLCDYHSDIGLRCSKTLVFSDTNDPEISTYEYWRGIEFVNSESSTEFLLGGQMKHKVSKSILKHVVISDSGLSDVGNATAAIRVFGQPPRMDNIEVKNSIYGIMIEDVDDAIRMSNINIYNNLAYPLFINTSWGQVHLDHLKIENNGGDGIRIVRQEKVIIGTHDFCKFANLGPSQSFPVILSHEQTFFTAGRDCCQEFLNANQLTVHFPVLRSTPNNLIPDADSNRRISIPAGVNLGKDAHLVIYDDYRDEFPFRLRITNGTRAQSIVSKSGRLKICYEPAAYRTVLFTIEVVAEQEDEWSGQARDVEISNSLIQNNEGRGIWIDNPRSGVRILNTTVANHNYLSGIHIENGTSEVIIQGGTIKNNTGHGIYLNLAGGYFHIDNSTVIDNSLTGILVDYDKRPELVPFNHTLHVGYSLVGRNGGNGLFIGNICRSDAHWNISMNSFVKNLEDAIVFKSCLPFSDLMINQQHRLQASRLNLSNPDQLYTGFHGGYQELSISHNVFHYNVRRAIHIAPIFFVRAMIRHNLFRDHLLAVLYISNQELGTRLINSMNDTTYGPTNVRIASNRFYSNHGRYVANIGLQEDNPRHNLMFTKNFLEANVISEPYNDLKPRSRVSAVVVVSSSNTKVIRNRFNNPQSTFEIGSHLEMQSKVINATTNFWGYGLDAASAYRRIFDRKNRYNLAQIEFLQYLLSPDDLEYASDLSFDRERDKISHFKNGTRLGGEVKGYEELETDIYTVQDDIFIRPGAHLVVKPGTVFKFQDGVGVMVQGRLDAIGKPNSQITFTSIVASSRVPHPQQSTTTPTPFSSPWISREDEFTSNETRNLSIFLSSQDRLKREINFSYGSGSHNVRLSHTTMGRLEVQIDGYWGSVCDYGFDIDDAAVVCQQLGMIINRDDWLLEKFQYYSNDHQQASLMSTNALMTNVRCDPSLDTDILKCKSEISLRGDFDGMCNSEVGIRCFPPSWSGIRFGVSADVSTMEHVTIQRAGMFDYASYLLRPALQIDFNRHVLSSLVVRQNSDSGLGIMWNDVIGRHFPELSITDSKFSNNERHGVELRSRGLTFKRCSISNNQLNGFDYSPTFSSQDLEDLISWLPTEKNIDNLVNLVFPLQLKHFSVPSSEESYRFFIFPKNPPSDIVESFTIGTDIGHMLSVHLLNPVSIDSSEALNMSTGLTPESPVWDLRLNTTAFPMVSPSYKFHFNYSTGRKPFGRMVLYVRSRYNNRDLRLLTRHVPAHLVMAKFEQTANNINARLINSLTITQCNITKNGIGMRFRHPNYPYDPSGSYNYRFANETTNITNNIFDSNYFSSLSVSSDHYEPSYEESIKWLPASEIYYYVLSNKFQRNRDGIRQFSRDIRQSHNVFHWTINDTLFTSNRGGGVNIVLPYYLRYDLNLSHTVDINNNSFQKNNQFELAIDGHFSILNLTSNVFRENKCRNSMISFAGMEKILMIKRNSMEQNTCNRIIEINIQSHAEKMGFLPSHFEYNSIKMNRRVNHNISTSGIASSQKHSRMLAPLHPLAVDHALSLRGIQVINISRNLFVNPDLRYELVVASLMDPDEKSINATENYWGFTSSRDISDRIFDFDDWNNFAVAEFSPYLNYDSFNAASNFAKAEISQTNEDKPLGGRLVQSLVLKSRREPYIVQSDFTIMSNASLVIERGVTLEFMPNVGLLVLGNLIATGTRDKPIVMRPLLSALDVYPSNEFLRPPVNTHSSFIMPSGSTDPLSYERIYTSKHYQLAYSIDLGSVRLCKNEICNDGQHIYDNNVEEPNLRQEVFKNSNNTWKMDGFLEIFNMTNLQWVPVCDPIFTEYAARVVCRQLGFSHLAMLKRGRRYTIEQEQVTSIKSWLEPIQCEGHETALASCPLAPKGFTNHSSACTREGNQFVYIYCQDFPEMSVTDADQNHGPSNEHVNHWGGIRFSCPSLIGNSDPYNVNLEASNPYRTLDFPDNSITTSRLQYVSVDRAGMLHRKKSPAIQVLQCPVQLDFVAVSNSAHHGIDIISSLGNQNFHHLRLRNNLGVGLSYISLSGSSSATRVVPYLPLKHLEMSSDIHGLVDICGANKEIRISDRILLFYRYGSQPADCVKIISSRLRIKHLGIRMLQFDLFNSTSYTSRPDFLRIVDGDVFDRNSRPLVELGVTEKHRLERPELKFYQSSDSTMTIILHANGANPYHGFIAEVVTTPVSYNIQRDTYNNITFSEMTGNKLGAFSFYSAGESTPNLILRHNRFEFNCIHLFGNFTSCVNPVYMELQNCQKIRLSNSLVKNNQGGVMIKSYSHTAVSALEAIIENNVFESNLNTNTLAIIGPKSDPYQTTRVTNNIFTRNSAPYLSNIVLSRVLANFSHNIVSGNSGRHQVEVLGFDKIPFAYQTFDSNWIYNNSATFERDQSTIFGTSAGQTYRRNYIVNAENSFEISTMNWSRYDVKPYHLPKDDEIIHLTSGDGSTKDVFRKTADAIPISIVDTKKIDLYHAMIDAKFNWWGFNTTTAIQGRIRDRSQHEELIKVDFYPFLESNRSVLNGICAGGWQRVGQSCLVYIGVRMTYQEAKDFCDKERAALPLLRGNHYEISVFVKTQERDYDERVDRVWVRSFEVYRDACPALNDLRTKNYDCFDRYAFICERNPQAVVSLLYWYRETGGLIALILALITSVMIICCSMCWGFKSRERKREKLERKSFIYASMRSSRSALNLQNASNNFLSEAFLHRQIYNPEKSSITDSSNLSTPASSGLEPHFNDKVHLDPGYNANSNRPATRLGGSMNSVSSHYTNQAAVASKAPLYRPLSIEAQPDGHSLSNYFNSPSSFNTISAPVSSSKVISGPHSSAYGANIDIGDRTDGLRNPRSQTSSFSGSQINGQISDPLPAPPPPPPPLKYNQIDYDTLLRISEENHKRAEQESFQPNDIEIEPQLHRARYLHSGQNTSEQDADLIVTPTLYDDQFEVYKESTTAESFMETYQDEFNGTLQELNTERTTFTTSEKLYNSDLINQNGGSSRIAMSGNADYPFDYSDLTYNRNQISLNPQGVQNYADDDDSVLRQSSSASSSTIRDEVATKPPRSFSDSSARVQTPSLAGSGYVGQAHLNRYCVETSFDQASPTMAPTSTFGSSQRLSPVSSSFDITSDSKQGSRVYLETTFE